MKKEVLIVDDNEQARKIAKYALEAGKVDFNEAANGSGALNILLNEKPDLIVLDWIMPTLSGLEMILMTDNILAQIESKEKSLEKKKIFNVILYTSVRISELKLPKSSHFKFLAYISKEWSVDYQIKKIRNVFQKLEGKI